MTGPTSSIINQTVAVWVSRFLQVILEPVFDGIGQRLIGQVGAWKLVIKTLQSLLNIRDPHKLELLNIIS